MEEVIDAWVIGAGLTGSIVARHLAEKGKKVVLVDRRSSVGGNLRDHIEEHGFLVQDYGPHAFHTDNPRLVAYLERFGAWKPYRLRCGAVIDGKYSPTPFNFTTVDLFYPSEKAKILKDKLSAMGQENDCITVVDALHHTDPAVREYALFLYRKDYAPYTAKQWGISPDQIDSSVLKRVPLRLSYKDGYFDDAYQLMPVSSYSDWFENLLNHENIRVRLNTDAAEHLQCRDHACYWDGEIIPCPVIYTGALDELFAYRYGKLPYRSLRFAWGYDVSDSLQEAPVVAYPQAEEFTRITEYKKLTQQERVGTVYAKEYPLPSDPQKAQEPYYPVLTENSMQIYRRYRALAEECPTLYPCGRLGDFQYYNMDQAMERAMAVCEKIDANCLPVCSQ